MVLMEERKNEIILFENQGVKLEVNLKDETVWLNRQQMATLFNRDVKTIGKHINNALAEELADIPTVAKFATVQKEGEREVKREVEYYNLDMILSVGYRVKSDKGILFRKWANNVLKDYMLKGYAEKMLASTGHEEITFSSLSSSDYEDLPELTDCLIEKMDNEHVNISLPSLRIDAFSLDVMSKIQDVKKSSLTFAPEAGTQRLRNVINKGLTKEDIMNGALKAFKGGWDKVKLYFMMGLPTETYDDIAGIADLSEEITELFFANIPREERNGRVMVTASASYFVPKPFTPFQWAPMYTEQDFVEKAKVVKNEVRAQLNQRSIRYNWHEADVTGLEGILARGDRKISKAILYVYEHGEFFDAWSEFFHYDLWLEAFAACGIDIDFYTKRARSDDEIFPWDFIDVGVTKAFMLREWKTALSETVTPNCRMRCSGCGARQFGGGVCFENQN